MATEEELLTTIAALLLYESTDPNNTMLAQFDAEDLHCGGVQRLAHYCRPPASKPKHIMARALARQLDEPNEEVNQNDGRIQRKIYFSDSDDEDPYDNPWIEGKWNRPAALRVYERILSMLSSEGWVQGR